MTRKKFSLRSFRYALEGLIALFRTEPNSRIHLVAACLAIILGFFMKISAPEWLFITVAIAGVFITELINSAIEKMADLVDREVKPEIKLIKDMASASVLVAAFASVIVGAIVFIPHLFELFK